MRPAEQGFLLLTSCLGNPDRKVLTVAQFRILASRVQNSVFDECDRDLTEKDLTALGYGLEMAQRIVSLLNEGDLLACYLRTGEKRGCKPLSRISDGYPERIRQRLGLESPGCLWAKGDLSALDTPKISLVGSRDIRTNNRAFAWEAGVQAAKQGYTLVSGNARGADRIAQAACLKNGGRVICVVADRLYDKTADDRILYLSEDGFDQDFTPQRALSRNRVIHALGDKTLVAQLDLHTGGTWDGSVKNLRTQWSPLFCFNDGTPASLELQQRGAQLISLEDLRDISALQANYPNFFDQ